MKILIIEDEEALAKSMMQYLQGEKYTCDIASNSKDALRKTEIYEYDCILLDIGLPDGNGLDILRMCKADKKDEGVIIISARDALEDKIDGLLLGADDYLPKPFHLSELSARIAAVIRRRKQHNNNVVEAGEIKIDTIANIATAKGYTLNLTVTEYALLLFMTVNKNRVLSKTALSEHINAEAFDAFQFDALYAHIKNLKKKLLPAGCSGYIKSVYGMGYKMDV